jgi:hypothetical protein
MSAAFYTISFKATSNVLAVCSFEKQAPADQAAWDKLRDALVGSKLPIRLATPPMFEIAASLLAVDALSGTPDAELTTNPYLFQLSLASADPVVAGDGKDKLVKKAADNAYDSVAGDNGTKTVTVKLLYPSTPDVPAWLLYEGQSPVAGNLDPSDTTNKTIAFRLPTTVTIAADDEFVLLMQGLPAIHGVVP